MRLIYRGILPAVLGLYKGRPRGVWAERFEGVIGGSPVPPLPSWASCRAVPGRFAGGLATAVQGSIRLHHLPFTVLWSSPHHEHIRPPPGPDRHRATQSAPEICEL